VPCRRSCVCGLAIYEMGDDPGDVAAAAPKGSVSIAMSASANFPKLLVTGDVADRFEFESEFWFDQDNQLSKIILKLDDDEDCFVDVRQALIANYGRPNDEGIQLFGDGLVISRTDFSEWLDKQENLKIKLWEADCCTLVYSPTEAKPPKKIKGL